MQRGLGRVLVGFIVGVGVLGLCVVGVVYFLNSFDAPARATHRCYVSDDESTYSLRAQQADNSALIAAVGVDLSMAGDGVAIALATAMQESSLYNIDYGDRDSVGLFQQRPSQGWGSVEQIMDPVYSSTQFYTHLKDVPDYAGLPLTVAAQTVQRSAFPDAYAQHEDSSRAWAAALSGNVSPVVSCSLPDQKSFFAADEQEEALRIVEERVSQDFPDAKIEVVSEHGYIDVDPSQLPGKTVKNVATVMQWSVLTVHSTSVVAVTSEDWMWSLSRGREAGSDIGSAWHDFDSADSESDQRFEQPESPEHIRLYVADYTSK
ncbi:hypothetical protein [Timonella sp. A28]|uniref:hypothetical protein n=1 Tax=Timonella sp. A28 TaxID=3442640 RepID=UPI003EBB077A